MAMNTWEMSDFGPQIGPFMKYLQECGIIPQYTLNYTPKQNGMPKRHKHVDIVSAMNRSNLLVSLWGEVLNVALHICN